MPGKLPDRLNHKTAEEYSTYNFVRISCKSTEIAKKVIMEKINRARRLFGTDSLSSGSPAKLVIYISSSEVEESLMARKGTGQQTQKN